jgi:predicted nucleic acid-binding protein
VKGRPRKYVLDTQLYINAFRDSLANEALQQFHRAFAPFEYLSVIVAQELRAGAQDAQARKSLEQNVLDLFLRANRTVTPSARAWHASGDVIAEMARSEGLEVSRMTKAFANDILIALTCHETGCVLITENERDFQRIKRFVAFEFEKPWPR